MSAPDSMEILLGDFLRTHSALVALEANVAGKTPDDPVKPWVRVTQLDERKENRRNVRWLVNYFVQLDCIAGSASVAANRSQREATDLKNAVRDALENDLTGTVFEGVTVTCVEFTQIARMPDTSFEPARERFVISAQVYAHP